MNCYTHQKTAALGICKACGRGVCQECSQPHSSNDALVCSSPCRERVLVVDQLNERAELIYGIGRHGGKKAGIPTIAIVYLIMALFFLIANLVTVGDLTSPGAYILDIMAFGFILIGLFSWYRGKKKGITF